MYRIKEASICDFVSSKNLIQPQNQSIGGYPACMEDLTVLAGAVAQSGVLILHNHSAHHPVLLYISTEQTARVQHDTLGLFSGARDSLSHRWLLTV